MNLAIMIRAMSLAMCISVSWPLQAAVDDTHDNSHKEAFFATLATNNRSPGSALPLSAKMEYLSATLLGTLYLDGNLGEGEQGKYDRDPLSRFDVFDCTTYVETVLAGAMSASADEFVNKLTAIRYKSGEVSFVTRNHFPSVDWIPNNQDKLTDISAQIAGDKVQMANTVIDKRAWYQQMGESRIQGIDTTPEHKAALLAALQQEGKDFSPQPVSTPYVPLTAVFISQPASEQMLQQRQLARAAIEKDDSLDDMAKQKALHELELKAYIEDSTINTALLDSIPTGSVISMVRPDYDIKKWIGTNMNISHQALAIQMQDGLYIRHASAVYHKVVDENFVEYFSRYLVGSSLKGFNVQVLKQMPIGSTVP